MACDDLALRVDKDWIGKPKLQNGPFDFSDLIIAVGPRVVFVWLDSVDRPLLNLQRLAWKAWPVVAPVVDNLGVYLVVNSERSAYRCFVAQRF